MLHSEALPFGCQKSRPVGSLMSHRGADRSECGVAVARKTEACLVANHVFSREKRHHQRREYVSIARM
jgi:hypothetical protein